MTNIGEGLSKGYVLEFSIALILLNRHLVSEKARGSAPLCAIDRHI
jgi:hypothetical protein